jgi:hypothetical protein
LYGAGTAPNHLAGNLLIGSTNNFAKLYVGGVTSTATTQAFIGSQPSITGALTNLYSYWSNIVGNLPVNVTNAYNFIATQSSMASSTITNLFGFFVESSLTTGTNNYGFYGNIAAATGRWNLYMNGTAANYMNGELLLGSTSNSGEKLQVTGTMKVTGNVAVDTNVLFVDTANDRVGIGTASPSVLLHSSGVDGSNTNVFRLTNTANLGTTAWANTVSHDIQFHYTDGSFGPVVYGSIRAVGNPNSGLINAGTIDTDLSFLTAGYDVGGGLTEKFRIKATGQIRFVPRATAPNGAQAGDVYYNSTDNKHYGYNGTTWNAFY